MEDCLICKRIENIKNNTNQYFVLELETGFVVLGDYQFYKGYTLFLCKQHVSELHDLKADFKKKYLEEMSSVAEAVFKAFKPLKLNYELLGNANSHLHWHIFPRYKDDFNPKMPIWSIDEKIRCSKEFKPSNEELVKLKEKLMNFLKT